MFLFPYEVTIVVACMLDDAHVLESAFRIMQLFNYPNSSLALHCAVILTYANLIHPIEL
jgi:hypothetical protein